MTTTAVRGPATGAMDGRDDRDGLEQDAEHLAGSRRFARFVLPNALDSAGGGFKARPNRAQTIR